MGTCSDSILQLGGMVQTFFLKIARGGTSFFSIGKNNFGKKIPEQNTILES